MAGNYIERWICNVCVTPCTVGITTTDDKLPSKIKGQIRFQKMCICGELECAIWERLSDVSPRDELIENEKD